MFTNLTNADRLPEDIQLSNPGISMIEAFRRRRFHRKRCQLGNEILAVGADVCDANVQEMN